MVDKLSQLDQQTIANYIVLVQPSAEELELLSTILAYVKSYISSYTGLTAAQMDEHPDLVIAALALAQDAYDNRCATSGQTLTMTPTVQSILDLHAVNLVPTQPASGSGK